MPASTASTFHPRQLLLEFVRLLHDVDQEGPDGAGLHRREEPRQVELRVEDVHVPRLRLEPDVDLLAQRPGLLELSEMGGPSELGDGDRGGRHPGQLQQRLLLSEDLLDPVQQDLRQVEGDADGREEEYRRNLPEEPPMSSLLATCTYWKPATSAVWSSAWQTQGARRRWAMNTAAGIFSSSAREVVAVMSAPASPSDETYRMDVACF